MPAHTLAPRLALATALLAPVVVTGQPAAAAPQAPDRHVTVLSFNIHAGIDATKALNLDGVAAEIRASGADIVLLQEVDRHFGARSSFADEPAELAQRLGMHYAYAANLDLEPLEPGQERRQYGTAILSRYPIQQQDNTLLPNLPGLEQRGLLHARVNVRGVKVDVYDTHLQHNTPSIRKTQAETVVKEITNRACPSILGGDLNARPDEEPARIVAAALVDSWPEAGQGPGETYNATNPTARIDYVFHSAQLHATSAQVLPTQVSDHRAVRVELDLPGSLVGRC